MCVGVYTHFEQFEGIKTIFNVFYQQCPKVFPILAWARWKGVFLPAPPGHRAPPCPELWDLLPSPAASCFHPLWHMTSPELPSPEPMAPPPSFMSWPSPAF